MARALQVPSWPSPIIDGASLSDVFAEVVRFEVDVIAQTYTIHVRLFANEAAKAAGKSQIAKIYFSANDGIFPSYNLAIADSSFLTPLLALRDWMYDRLQAADVRFAGATDIN